MNKRKILDLSKEEAYKLGQSHFEIGKSKHYNPYRNIDLFKNKKIAALNNSYLDGYQSVKKP
jgi:hypothetical protein